VSAAPTLSDRPFLDLAAVDDAARFLERSLREAARPGEPVAIVLPAPAWSVEAAASALPAGDGVLWSARGTALARDAATAGRALRLTADEAGLDALGGQADALWRALRVLRHPAAGAFVPFLAGGLAFAPGAAPGAWERFGAGHLDLPRWTFVPGALALALAGTEPDPPARWVEELRAIAARRTPPAAALAGTIPRALGREGLEPEAWRALVEEIRTGIDRGAFAKIVLARREVVSTSEPIDPAAVFARLGRAGGDGPSFRFCFREGDAAFVGLSPELLVEIDGLAVATEAVAGSAHRRAGAGAGPLLESAKDRAEHAIVVEAIRGRLEPLCDELAVAAEPAVRSLEHVSHLVTAIRGRLKRPAAPLELVERLHPTPSVGGDPRAAALRFLAAREPAPRGWYAGPVGWTDASGRAQFAVGIRSALLLGPRAHLYAGAGIVRASDPDAEFAETAVKLRTLLDALGLEPPP
jgi:menaquinone-specific isochorismate synthase